MSDADGMGSDTQPAAECGSSDLDLRRLLKSSYTCTLSSTAAKFVEKFCNGRSYSGSLALICLAALLMVDQVSPEDQYAAASLLLANQCLHTAHLQADSFLIAYQQIINKWRVTRSPASVAWLQWLLSQAQQDTGCGLSDVILRTVPGEWIAAYADQYTSLPPVGDAVALRQRAARKMHHSIPFVFFAPPPGHTTMEEASWLENLLHLEDLRVRTLRELLLAGTKVRLEPEQAREADALLAVGGLVASAAAPPSFQVGSLVQHNQQTGAALLAALLPSSQADQYLQTVADMGVTIPALEIVGQLVQRGAPVPSDFLLEFVTQCLASCSAIQEVGTAARQVRMVCAFLGVLLREKLAELAPLLPALQAFSIEQSRYREAAQLFGRLKELEASFGPPGR